MVNIAARLEAMTRDHDAPILVSETTRAMCTGPVRFEPAPPAPIRGRAQPLSTFVPSFDPDERVTSGIWDNDHDTQDSLELSTRDPRPGGTGSWTEAPGLRQRVS